MQSSSALPVRRGALHVAIAATAWGTGGAVAAVLYDVGGIGPVSVSFWRFLAGLGLLLAAHLSDGPGGREQRCRCARRSRRTRGAP
ncbi:hypothetical protein [Streptomyces nitrosporeus]|uniref:hypothetical protein n=1 Tax=Streptomyces nitrosporeus TaxID=28894 RepID=UPI001FCC916D|nr:hypothetical protein [Streptomyces nitrosporeus]